MTDSRFADAYKKSVTEIKLPENFKDNILSNLNFGESEKVISVDFEKGRKKSVTAKKNAPARVMPRAIISAAAAVVLVACVLLLFSVFRSSVPVGTMDISLNISSATNLAAVGGARVQFKNREGEYLKDENGEVLTAYADDKGRVTATVPEEDLTVEVAAEGFILFEGTAEENIYISPVMTEDTYRAVLTWREDCDLDAYMTLTTAEGTQRLHYFNSDIVNQEGEVIAALDTDSQTKNAPETITFIPKGEGVWRFSAASYSSLGSADSVKLAASGATVKLYKGDSLAEEFTIDTLSNGNVWSVFEIEKGKLTVLDTTCEVGALTEID